MSKKTKKLIPGIAPLQSTQDYKEPVVDFKSNGDIEVKLKGPDSQIISYNISSNGMGRYQWEDLEMDPKSLGKGAQAKVQLCRYRPTGDKLAMKVCAFDEQISKSGLVSDLAHVLAVENHPNVVASHDVYFRDGHLMILMEYCANGSLEDLLQKPDLKIPTNILSCITAQVVKGLHHLHTTKIIHRDLKPSNILINKEGVVKICDFGVSKTIIADQAAHTTVGARAYLSPERVRGDAYFLPSDVWALGVTVAQLALGYYPWINIDMTIDLVDLVASGRASVDWPPEGDYSEEVKDFVAKCLTPDPDSRPTTTQLLTHPFLLLNEGKDVKLIEWLRPSAWKKARSPEGKIFYINTKTGVKQWTKPSAADYGWEIKYDREGRTWYVNIETKEKTMEKPEVLAHF